MKIKKAVCVLGIGFAILLTGCVSEAQIENVNPSIAESSQSETEDESLINAKQEIENQKLELKKQKEEEERIRKEQEEKQRIENEKAETEKLKQIQEAKEAEIKKQNEKSKGYFPLTKAERQYIINIVSGEAGSDTLEGKMAVAQCLLNAMQNDKLTPKQVRKKYKYSGWNSNFENEDPENYKEVEKAVSKVFDEGKKVTKKNILWFHNKKVNPTFHKSQEFVDTFGVQKFYAPKN